jgi:hypothetical protein
MSWVEGEGAYPVRRSRTKRFLNTPLERLSALSRNGKKILFGFVFHHFDVFRFRLLRGKIQFDIDSIRVLHEELSIVDAGQDNCIEFNICLQQTGPNVLQSSRPKANVMEQSGRHFFAVRFTRLSANQMNRGVIILCVKPGAGERQRRPITHPETKHITVELYCLAKVGATYIVVIKMMEAHLFLLWRRKEDCAPARRSAALRTPACFPSDH